MSKLGVEIGGNFVSFAELRKDVQACYRKGSNFCFLPETVEALLDYIERAADNSPRCPECGEYLVEDDRVWECVNPKCGNCR